MPNFTSRSILRLLPLPLLLAVPARGASLPAAISGLAISPDGGKALVSADLDGVPNAWAVPVAGGPPVQLTREKRPVRVVSYFPGDERFLFRRGPAGDDDHLFVRELDGRTVELAPGKTSRFLGWSPDGRSLRVEIVSARGETRDLMRIAVDGYRQTRLDRNGSDIARLAAVSPDERYLAYAEDYNDLTRNLRVRDRQTGQDRALEANEGFASHVPLRFGPDGGLLMLGDDDSEFRYLDRFDVATGARRTLVKKAWDVLDGVVSPDGKRLAVIAGGDTLSTLELYDAATLQPVPLPDLPAIGEVSAVAFSRDGRTLAFVASGSALPPGLWAYDLARPAPPRRLLGGSGSGTGSGDQGGWVAGEVTRFKSFDGESIPGILYKPRQAAPDHKRPALIWIHDGPSGQARLGFDPLVQTLVQRGYAVFAINERGSSGYGKHFQQLDDRRHGMGDLQDCVAAKAMLAATGWVDPGRIAIGGVGFGGFLTLDALAFQPQEFAAGIDLFGVANWQRVLNGIAYKATERTVLSDEMGHAADVQAGVLMAPVDHAGDIARPLLIVQGGLDTLAIPAEAGTIAATMKAAKRTVELLALPEEGHGLGRREDREKVYGAVADFLDRNLKPAASR
ncbi:MAG TPA: prolyl oligopeptidase family serine peptidase [Thermoanaerobaculia bacterium]|jgi:dipeptidyl aminopeptidase/acylaminoacyl peptidase